MADSIYRILSTSFERPTEVLGIFNQSRSGPPEKTARAIANRIGEEVQVEWKLPLGWSNADLVGDFGMISPSRTPARP